MGLITVPKRSSKRRALSWLLLLSNSAQLTIALTVYFEMIKSHFVYTFAYSECKYVSSHQSSLSHAFLLSDVLPPNALYPEGATEEDPLFHFPSDDAAAVPLCVWNVPTPVHENDLPSANVYPHTYQVCLVKCFIVNTQRQQTTTLSEKNDSVLATI